MSDANFIEISGVVVSRIFYRGEPVITFTMVDEVHERPEGTAKRTFHANRGRFIEGEDFILASADQKDAMRTFDEGQKYVKRTFDVDIPSRGLTLITRRGYLKLVKPMTDDRAWAVQGEMIDRYFAFEQMIAPAVVDQDETSRILRAFGDVPMHIIDRGLRAVEAAYKAGGPTAAAKVWPLVMSQHLLLPGMRPPSATGIDPEEGVACLRHILHTDTGDGLVANHLLSPAENSMDALTALGLRVQPGNRLFVADQLPGHIFHGTKWAANNHREALLAIPGAVAAPNPLSLKGFRCRGLIVPLATIAEVSDAH